MSLPAAQEPTRVRYGVLAFCCVLSMITYLDRVCFGTVAPFIQKEFGLSDTQKGWLFTAFALSYAIFEVPTGWLGDVYGPRKTLIRIVLWWSLFTVLTALIFPNPEYPMLAFTLMFAVRFLFGVGEAGAYPNIARAFHNWFPFTQRAFAKGAVWMAGRFAGGITGFLVLGLVWEEATTELPKNLDIVAASAVGLGAGEVPLNAFAAAAPETITHWRHVFWIFGFIGAVWCVFFWFWFKDRPEQKPGVNQAEIDLIHEGTADEHSAKRVQVPWGKLLASGNLWLLCMMYFCAGYGWYFNITWLPGYLRDYFGETGGGANYWRVSLMVGMPLLLGSVACLLGGILSDRYIQKTGDRKWGRRLFGVLGHGLAAICYFLAIFLDNNVWLFVFAIGFAAFFNDMMMGAAWATCIDIGKRYAGIVAGCMNTIGNLGGAAAGVLTGMIIDWSKSRAPEGSSPAVLLEYSRTGWDVNLTLFSLVFVAGSILWLFVDATKPVAPDEPASSAADAEPEPEPPA